VDPAEPDILEFAVNANFPHAAVVPLFGGRFSVLPRARVLEENHQAMHRFFGYPFSGVG
jgi:hypothetical protein